MSWFSIQELEYLLRIVLAAVCGGAIGGYPRKKPCRRGTETGELSALTSMMSLM